jgi:hypothetical protein
MRPRSYEENCHDLSLEFQIDLIRNVSAPGWEVKTEGTWELEIFNLQMSETRGHEIRKEFWRCKDVHENSSNYLE